MALCVKEFKRLDHMLSTARGQTGVELVVRDKCGCVIPNWTSTAQEKAKSQGVILLMNIDETT